MPPAHCTSGSRTSAQISPACSSSRCASASAASSAQLRALWPSRVPGVGRGGEHRLHQQRRIGAAVQRDVAHRQRADGLAVVAVVQGDELRAPRFVGLVAEPVERHLQRHLDPRRAVVGVEHLGQRRAAGLARGDGQQALGQLHRGRMRAAGQDHLFEAARLARDRPGDARLGMAVQVHPPAAHRVQRAAAVVAHQPGPLAARHRQQRQHVGVFAHLGAGMPEHRKIARTPARGLV